jgi:hypothetical protein
VATDTDTCKHCRKPIIRCGSVPVHAGCGSGYGWIHSNPEQWGHSNALGRLRTLELIRGWTADETLGAQDHMVKAGDFRGDA